MTDQRQDNVPEPLASEPYREEVEARWGKEAYAKSAEIVRSWSKEKMQAVLTEGEAINRSLAECVRLDPASEAAQAAVERHFRHITGFYDPSWPLLKIYRSLGEMYVSDPRFAANYAKCHPDLPEFLRQAMAIFCDRREMK